MDITINITGEDIVCNPNIVDAIVVLSNVVAVGEKANATPEKESVKETKAITQAVETPAVYAEEEKTVTEEDKSVTEGGKTDTKEDESVPEEETEYTPEEVRAALAKLSKAKGKEVVKELLGSFDAKKFSEVDPQKYDPLMEAINEVK